MDVIALVVSVFSLAVAAVGTLLAHKRSSEALAESRKAAATAIWSGVQEAVQRLIGFDPAFEPIGERLANLRIAMIALVDELDDWAGLDTWLEEERVLGAVLGQQAIEQSRPGDTVDERLRALDPFLRWAQVLGGNLRHFRRVGYDAAAAAELREHATTQLERVCKEHGWPLPSTTLPGYKTLGD